MAEAVVSDTFQQEVVDAEGPVLVDFWASWCAPCRMLAPTIEKLAEEYAGRVSVRKLDVDRSPDIAAQYGVQSIPTVIVFQKGREVTRWVGVQRPQAYAQELDRVLAGVAN